jgi:NO-binding membrane sensor protein with MHYT domain
MTPEILLATYDPMLVAASFLLSAIGAYCALASVSLVRRADGGLSKVNVVFSGVALGGVGIWSMHFMGMMAWDTGVAMGYRLPETVVSLVAAVAVSAVALGYMASGPFSNQRLLVAGPLAGLGVAAMHFLGIASMRFGGFLQWDYVLVAVAVGIAVVAATAALWLAFHVKRSRHRVAASLLMATAVCAMHYTGMAAADVVCTTADRYSRLPDLMYRSEVQILVLLVAVGTAIMIALDSMLQKFSAGKAAASN